jgi:oligoribonuclease NrnB/cAMP/cGMP phosphodiesterase (DHH superfamily)
MILIGMGSVILLKLIYTNVKQVLCEGYDVNSWFEFYYDNKLLDEFDRIYITDLHLNKKNLDIINQNKSIHDKIILFDHNESVTEFNSYDFVNIIIKDDNGYCCSTTLLYDYLLSNNMIKPTEALNVFCEATKAYDTGQWKLNAKNEIARDLALLFDVVGIERYIEMMCQKLKEETNFFFNYDEIRLINIKKQTTNEKVMSYIKNIRFKNIDGYNAGIIFISYEYRNEIAQYLRETKMYDIDLVMLVAIDKNSISIRNINPDINVRPIAEKMGGKGHFGAAGCNIDEKNITKVLNVLF